MKEYVIVGGIVIAGVLIYAIVRYKNSKKESGFSIERGYVDELNISEIKKWFSEKFSSNNEQGILLYPTPENLQKWKIELSNTNSKMLVQAVYDNDKEEVTEYREISFETLSEKLKTLLDDNGGCLVIEK